jgi:hypothetical protein
MVLTGGWRKSKSMRLPNLARLFSYTRRVEELLAQMRAEMDRLRIDHAAEIEVLRAEYSGIINEERRERRWLQDRLLQRNGSMPIYEPSPAVEHELERRRDRDELRRAGPREAAIADSSARRSQQVDKIRKERDEFLAAQKVES